MYDEHFKRRRERREKLSAYFYDISKLSFAAVLTGAVLPLFTSPGSPALWAAAVFGALTSVISAALANKILK